MKPTESQSKPAPRSRKILGWIIRFSVVGLLVSFILLGIYVFFLGNLAKEKFASQKWELPARIYGRPLELYPGLGLNAAGLMKELDLMQYRQVDRIDFSGSFSRSGNTFTLFSRSFSFGEDQTPAQKIRLTLQNGRINSLRDMETHEPLSLVRLDPAHIGSFYPTHNQDRLWVKITEVSPLLPQTILAVEDQHFYDHLGVRPLAILRALIVNIKQGRTVQGGSTLTQQLVKNLFLTRSRTLKRKFDEAIMALSLEWSYEKEQILEAYLNEVYMGQDGKRAIHGFGMAARFYFGRSLNDLRPQEIALLAGLLKGPSYYDPRRQPERALHRRNTILTVMEQEKLILPGEAEAARKSPLNVIPDPPSGTTRFPAFLDLVKRRLLEEYPEEELRSEGLRIFTTFDPQIQFAAESAVADQLDAIERGHGFPSGELEASVIITATGSNEVLGLVGGRKFEEKGFNRALDARRSIGSLIKPAVYLTALRSPTAYTLISPLNDGPIRVRNRRDDYWAPQNYDLQHHGMVPLYRALAHSYNVATVRLGLELGLENVFDTVQDLGVQKEFEPFPSALLGTMSMSVLEVVQMYQTIASSGFYSPARAIHGVYRPDGSALQRYPLTVNQNIDPDAVYLLTKALQAVVVEGTALSLKKTLPLKLGVAGKTGTTDDLRDSWFAGFTGNHLAVVWVGRDDNRPTGLTGASGALQVWGNLFSKISTAPLNPTEPENINWVVVDPATGYQADKSCSDRVAIPFIEGSEPEKMIVCDRYGRPDGAPIPSRNQKGSKPTFMDWVKGIFQ